MARRPAEKGQADPSGRPTSRRVGPTHGRQGTARWTDSRPTPRASLGPSVDEGRSVAETSAQRGIFPWARLRSESLALTVTVGTREDSVDESGPQRPWTETSPLLRWAPVSVAALSLLSRGWLGRWGAVHPTVRARYCSCALAKRHKFQKASQESPLLLQLLVPACPGAGKSCALSGMSRPAPSPACQDLRPLRHVKTCALSGPRTRIPSNPHQLNIPGAPLPRRRFGRPCLLARDNHSMFCAAPLDASAASTAPSVASPAPPVRRVYQRSYAHPSCTRSSAHPSCTRS